MQAKVSKNAIANTIYFWYMLLMFVFLIYLFVVVYSICSVCLERSWVFTFAFLVKGNQNQIQIPGVLSRDG